eukprot:1156199-Pelagomonas_calceolata.AAC.7
MSIPCLACKDFLPAGTMEGVDRAIKSNPRGNPCPSSDALKAAQQGIKACLYWCELICTCLACALAAPSFPLHFPHITFKIREYMHDDMNSGAQRGLSNTHSLWHFVSSSDTVNTSQTHVHSQHSGRNKHKTGVDPVLKRCSSNTKSIACLVTLCVNNRACAEYMHAHIRKDVQVGLREAWVPKLACFISPCNCMWYQAAPTVGVELHALTHDPLHPNPYAGARQLTSAMMVSPDMYGSAHLLVQSSMTNAKVLKGWQQKGVRMRRGSSSLGRKKIQPQCILRMTCAVH